jgi:ribosomal protein S18 acetylase RimI-like enzyme
MDLVFRNARADDQGPIAELVYSSGNDVYDYLHGSRARALAFIDHEFRSGRGFAGYSHLSVAVLEGQVVATGSFYDRAAYAPRSRETLLNTLTFHKLRGLAVLPRMQNVGRVMKAPKPGELYLSNFGVLPALRGRGIGTRLLAARLERAAAEGYTLLGLHVSTGNPRGQALYERLGLTMTREVPFPDPRAAVLPGRKMERVIAA